MATQPKPTTAMEIEQTIRAIAQEYTKHMNARDTSKLVSLFTNDARMYPPFRPMAEGTNNLRQAIEQTYIDYDPRNLKPETIAVEVNGNMAISYGTFTMDVKTPKGTRITDNGKWLVTLRQTDKTWLITNHCWNTNLPMTTFAT